MVLSSVDFIGTKLKVLPPKSN